ncbi:MAG: tRNA pseudouridine(55) synthase TruB [Buchnera aphidicola (Kaburagia rhusicola ensigallis)]
MFFREFKIINGILLIDKPRGFSSNNILQKVKKILHIKKAGHTGSLDPIATGMLPICCGKATKFSQFLLNSNKHYRVIARLGYTTNTSDSEGKTIKIRKVNCTLTKIIEVLNSFQGDIYQIPPMYSAIKYHGQSLYKYARKGITVPRVRRKITIYKLRYINYYDYFLELDVTCSKGTYIRTLIEDIGENLGCGAHVIKLHRVQVGNYPISKMITMSQLNKLHEHDSMQFFSKSLSQFLMPLDTPVLNFPEINLSIEKASKIKQGNKIRVICHLNSKFFRITEGQNKNFIGIGKINNINELLPYRII